MLKTVLLVIAGLAAGLAAAALFGHWPSSAPRPTGVGALDPAPALATARGSDEARLAAIEAELERARRDRETLREALTALSRERGASPDVAPATAPVPSVEETPRFGPPGAPRFGRDGEEDGADALARRVAELTAGGFAPDRAQWIAEREARLRMDALYSRYEAERSGEPPDRQQFFSSQNTLRAELGDSDYERYLAASGRPTNVPVGQVLVDSPAETAGLKAGDRIVAYGGQRVFDMRELNALTLNGAPGEPVAVDVVRDGNQIQLYLPRGPLGIFGSRRGR